MYGTLNLCWEHVSPFHSSSQEVPAHFNTLTKWPSFSRRHFKWIFLNENIWISIKPFGSDFIDECKHGVFPTMCCAINVSCLSACLSVCTNTPSLMYHVAPDCHQVLCQHLRQGTTFYRAISPLNDSKLPMGFICCKEWFWSTVKMDGLVQDCSISIANPLEILHSCIKTIEMVSQCKNNSRGCQGLVLK